MSDSDIARALPGDGLIADAEIQIDRATVIRARATDVWPWIVQLGKSRGGWYAPMRLQRLIVWPASKRAATRIVDELQVLREGDRVPDWGPGDPEFEVVTLDPPRALVYLSLRDRADSWRWPAGASERTDVMAFSWALILDDLEGGGCRLHIRLRGRFGRSRPPRRLMAGLGGLLDYLTIVVMFAGLKERVGAKSRSDSNS